MGAVARAVAAAAACWALCACGPVGPGSNSPTSAGKGESSVEQTPSSDYEGRKPFGERVDVITARSQLMGALARVRARVDAEFGARQWTWLDGDPNKLYDPCDDLHEGGYLDHSRQGIAPGFSKDAWPRMLAIVKEEVAPFGFTEVIDVSDGRDHGAYIHNTQDGGYVDASLTRENYFGMRYTTGCRPAPPGRKPRTAADPPEPGSPTSAGKGESSVEQTPSPYYEGRKPFGERVDVITARSQLMGALARVRSRVDAEFGARQWTWLDEDPNKLYDPCDDIHEGGYLDRVRQGIAFGFSNDAWPRLLAIVKEEVAPFGFTEVIDVSNDNSRAVYIYNTQDGGYVGASVEDNDSFGMDYMTGCRPAPPGRKPRTAADSPEPGSPTPSASPSTGIG